jgi:hypothetical protein
LYDELWNAPEFDRKTVDERRATLSEILDEPPKPEIATLDLIRVKIPKAGNPNLEWMSWCAEHREFFKHVVMRCTTTEGCCYYKFAYACQNPVLSAWHRVLLHDGVEETLAIADWADQDLHMWICEFTLLVEDTFFSDGYMFTGVIDVHFACDVYKRRSGYLTTDSDWKTVAALMLLLPATAGRPRAKKDEPEDVGPVVEAEPWMEDPAFWEFVKSGGAASKGEAPGIGGRKRPLADLESDAESDRSSGDSSLDELVELDALYERRAELDREADGREDAFTWCIRGGRWTKLHTSMACDSYRAQARGKSARAFCLLFKMRKSSSYHINKYTEEQCMDLCKAWCARMNWLYEMWSAQGCDLNFKFHSVD